MSQASDLALQFGYVANEDFSFKFAAELKGTNVFFNEDISKTTREIRRVKFTCID